MEPLIIEVKGKQYRLQIQDFGPDIDLDDIIGIDYSNILGELLTFPIVFNRIGILKAEINNIVQNAKLDLDIKKARLEEQYRNELTERTTDHKGNPKVLKPTISEVSGAVSIDEEFIAQQRNLLELEKKNSYMETLYWSCQSKDSKLNRFSEKIRPEQFEGELLQDTVNGVFIKRAKTVIR